MLPLDRYSRTALAVAAFGSFAGAYVTTPIAARGAAAPPMAIVPLIPPSPSPAPLAVEMPRHDPFSGEPAGAPSQRESSQRAPSDDTARTMDTRSQPRTPWAAYSPGQPADAGVPLAVSPLPANAGAREQPPPFGTPVARPFPNTTAPTPITALAPSSQARVTAIVTGRHPYALIDDAGTTRLVTLGDRIGDDIVAAITASEIRLASGRTMPLASTVPGGRPDAPASSSSPKPSSASFPPGGR